MLQEILKQGYIDPELLAELSEEEKQFLFYKMRQEQIRRWNEYDLEMEKKENRESQRRDGKAKIKFLKGSDGCDWVWVMGEHKNDSSIEDILKKEEHEAAILKAEKEADVLRDKEEAELKRKMEEERLKIIRENEQREAELKRQQKEAEEYQSLKEARLAMEKLELEKKKLAEDEKKRLAQLEAEEKRERRKSLNLVNSMQIKRCMEIFSTLEKKRQSMNVIAEKDSKEVESSWREQEKKAREAEEQMREKARNARREYQESMRRSMTLMQAAQAFQDKPVSATGKPKPPLPPKTYLLNNSLPASFDKKPRPLRPRGKDMIINWFQKEEHQRGAGREKLTDSIAPWFHGIINRADAERLLEDKPAGSFLVRVSERVWGYTISLREPHRCKHFLVDASELGYQFFGANQVMHKSLEEMVNFHKTEPLTITGQEILKQPCGQTVDPPDYWELYDSHVTEVTAL